MRVVPRLEILAVIAVAVLSTAALGALDTPASVAERLGAALKASKPHELPGVLPRQGKVQVRLDRMGPANGTFGTGQVQAILADFLTRGSVESFEVGHVESDGRTYALVRASAGLLDRRGRPVNVTLQLSLQPESDRWVVRGIKETAR